MSFPAIPMVFSRQHIHHAPLVEFMHGALLPYQESPVRAENLLAHLTASGIVKAQELTGPLVERALLTRVHDPALLDYLHGTSEQTAETLARDFASYHRSDLAAQSAYVYPLAFPASAHPMHPNWRGTHGFYAFDQTAPIGKGTWAAVLHSATIAHRAAQQVADGTTHYAYALCRPPGHHAGRDFIGGYCYLNNAAIAAETLLALGRIAILDVDYHHGNGTQAIFWDRADVFFASIHADPSADYPYYSGFADELGGGSAAGTTANAPLPLAVLAVDYFAALDGLIAQIMTYDPAALVVSLGFDTYKDDPIGSFTLDTLDYVAMGARVAAMRLPTVIIQEGGYRADMLGPLAEAFLRGLQN